MRPRPHQLLAGARAARERPSAAARLPVLAGVGVATPEARYGSQELIDALERLLDLKGEERRRLRRIVVGTGIEHRHAVLPPAEVIRLGTKARMEAYERLGPPLAAEAARGALGAAGVAAACVTDLIVVSCTGFSAPGLDAALVSALGLRPTVRRTVIGFMGCFGALIGLRTAAAACRAEESATVLLVCLELCSLHLRPDRDIENQVAAALFADGAAAALVRGPAAGEGPALGRLGRSCSLLIEEGRDWMTWRITDAGFAMTLSRLVPAAVREHLGAFVRSCTRGGRGPATYVVHPGGPQILDAADEALGLRGGRGLASARAVLRRCGNMSSATVLFVLDEALRSGEALPALLLALGPGLTIEGLVLHEPVP